MQNLAKIKTQLF